MLVDDGDDDRVQYPQKWGRVTLLAESARWGDTYRAVPYTRDVEWQTEYDRLMRDYFPHRTQSLIDQLMAAGLYTP